MKKIKMIVTMIIITFGFVLIPPNINASELTTTESITTEEVTADESNEGFNLDESLEKAKTWLVAGVLAIINSGFLGTIGYYIFIKMKNDALSKIKEAVDQNKISQATADRTIKIVNDGMSVIETKLNHFEDDVQNKINVMTGDIKDLIEKLDSKFLSLFNTAIQEYLESDLEEEIAAELEEPEEV